MNDNEKKFIPVITYLNPERDQEILDWLDTQPNRSATIREILQGHIQSKRVTPPSSGAEVQINQASIRAAVAEALAQHLDLSLIRELMEAVLHTALAKLAVTGPAPPVQDDENNSVLNDLDEVLLWD